MSLLTLVCGPIGAGKTTYTNAYAQEIGALRFSIDPWMQTLYAKDITTIQFDWMLERVGRCSEQIWDVTEQALALDVPVVLDLGFTTQEQRSWFYTKSAEVCVKPELHYLKASKPVRKQRVEKRNMEKDPAVYSIEVTNDMFEFMEPRFEVPSGDELTRLKVINSG